MKKSLTCLNVLGWLNITLFLWVILILITFCMRLYLLIQSAILKLHMNMHRLIDQPTRVDNKTSSVLDVILTSRPVLHRKSAVLKYTLSDHYLTYTHMEFGNTKPSVADHKAVKFRDMKNFDRGSFSNDLIWCGILNGSHDNDDNDDISWERRKLAYIDTCDKHAPTKSLRLQKRSNPWMTHDIIKFMYERDHVHARVTQSNDSKLWQDYCNLRHKVTCIIKEGKNVYFNDIHTLSRNDPTKCSQT